MSNNKEENKLLGLYLFLVVCALVLFLLWIKNLYFGALGGNPFDFSDLKNDESKRSALGALGDYFGGLLNPILAFLSFIALLWTLKLNQEELAETRKELARAAQAQEDSKKVMDAQLKTQSLQQFDSLFFSLLNQLTIKISEFQKEPLLKQQEHFYKDNFEKSKFQNLEALRASLATQNKLSSFFIFLYQIMRNIDEKLPTDNLKKDYSNVVRSLIPSDINKWLLVNCAVNENHDFNKFKKLLVKFEFFEHIEFYGEGLYVSSNLIHAGSLYPIEVYGKNIDSIKIYRSVLFNEFRKTSNFHKILISILGNTKEFKQIADSYREMNFLKENTEKEFDISKFSFYEPNSASGSYGWISVDSQQVNNFRLDDTLMYLQCSNGAEYELKLKNIESGGFAIDSIKVIK